MILGASRAGMGAIYHPASAAPGEFDTAPALLERTWPRVEQCCNAVAICDLESKAVLSCLSTGNSFLPASLCGIYWDRGIAGGNRHLCLNFYFVLAGLASQGAPQFIPGTSMNHLSPERRY